MQNIEEKYVFVVFLHPTQYFFIVFSHVSSYFSCSFPIFSWNHAHFFLEYFREVFWIAEAQIECYGCECIICIS